MVNGLLRSGPSPWYLHEDHIHPKSSTTVSLGSDTRVEVKRVLITNSKATHKMVLMDMDSSVGVSVKEYALTRYDVIIHLIDGPPAKRGDEGFYEKFDDHTDCNEGCKCAGDLDVISSM